MVVIPSTLPGEAGRTGHNPPAFCPHPDNLRHADLMSKHETIPTSLKRQKHYCRQKKIILRNTFHWQEGLFPSSDVSLLGVTSFSPFRDWTNRSASGKSTLILWPAIRIIK